MLKRMARIVMCIPILVAITYSAHNYFKVTIVSERTINSIRDRQKNFEKEMNEIKQANNIKMLNEMSVSLHKLQVEQELKRIEDSKRRKVTFHITYYTNADNALEGGQKDKKGRMLESHNYPIMALPSDVAYGSKVVFNEPVLGEYEYLNVDTGGAIRWINKNECKADIFIPNVSNDWLIRNTENRTVEGYIYK